MIFFKRIKMASKGNISLECYSVAVYLQNPVDSDADAIIISTMHGFIFQDKNAEGYYRVYKLDRRGDIPFMLVKPNCFDPYPEFSSKNRAIVKVLSVRSPNGLRTPTSKESHGNLFSSSISGSSGSETEGLGTTEETDTITSAFFSSVQRKYKGIFPHIENVDLSLPVQKLYTILIDNVLKFCPEKHIPEDGKMNDVGRLWALCSNLLI